MCAGMGCSYELYDGGCKKPPNLPCPFDDEAVEVYERFLDQETEKDNEEAREKKAGVCNDRLYPHKSQFPW